jgi:hypothetical protein
MVPICIKRTHQHSHLFLPCLCAAPESGPARKACQSIAKNTWDTFICPKWKEQLPKLAEYVKAAHAAAEKIGAFNSAETLARMPPSMYTPHLELRKKVIAALCEQTDMIDQQPQQSRRKPAIVLIVGQPCLGKAALALDVAHAISEKEGKHLAEVAPAGLH